MEQHLCPNCKKGWVDLSDHNVEYRYVLCDDCKGKVTKYWKP